MKRNWTAASYTRQGVVRDFVNVKLYSKDDSLISFARRSEILCNRPFIGLLRNCRLIL